jgi:hypothetical protein
MFTSASWCELAGVPADVEAAYEAACAAAAAAWLSSDSFRRSSVSCMTCVRSLVDTSQRAVWSMQESKLPPAGCCILRPSPHCQGPKATHLVPVNSLFVTAGRALAPVNPAHLFQLLLVLLQVSAQLLWSGELRHNQAPPML